MQTPPKFYPHLVQISQFGNSNALTVFAEDFTILDADVLSVRGDCRGIMARVYFLGDVYTVPVIIGQNDTLPENEEKEFIN